MYIYTYKYVYIYISIYAYIYIHIYLRRWFVAHVTKSFYESPLLISDSYHKLSLIHYKLAKEIREILHGQFHGSKLLTSYCLVIAFDIIILRNSWCVDWRGVVQY